MLIAQVAKNRQQHWRISATKSAIGEHTTTGTREAA